MRVTRAPDRAATVEVGWVGTFAAGSGTNHQLIERHLMQPKISRSKIDRRRPLWSVASFDLRTQSALRELKEREPESRKHPFVHIAFLSTPGQ
ncbi:MAG TPA: hypothetical protein VGO61_05750 [Steroidobacteraceae bacterium]|jgi:hypothetical protein|nr:hypothetical protein [Steroidobacteraceae bacterium]